MKLAYLPLLAMSLILTSWANAEPDIPAILKKDVLPKLAADLDNENVLIATRDIASLGPLARPILPDLIRRYNTAKPERKIELLLVLERVGGDAKMLLPIFEAALKDKAPEMQHAAISGILSLGADGAPGIPRILDVLRQEKEPAYTDWSSAPKLGAAAKPLIPFILRDLSKDGYFAGQMFASALTIDPNDPRLIVALSTILASSATTTGCSAAQSVLADPNAPRALLDLILAKQNGLGDWCLESLSTALKGRGLPPLKRRDKARTTPRGITLRLTTSKRAFMIGEPVPVTLDFTVSGERRFFADSKNYDRSGRMHHLGFTVTDPSGTLTPDPVRSRGGSMMGGLFGRVEVTTGTPFRQTADLNEWALLNRPGRHSVLASPGMIRLDAIDGPYTPIQSLPLAFEIIPATEQFIADTLSRARSMMKSPEYERREQAQHLLRFLMSPRALPLMIDGLDDEHGNVRIEASYGLGSYPSTAAVRKALLQAVHEGRPKRAAAIGEYALHLTQSEAGEPGTMWDDQAKWRLALKALQSRNMKRAKLPPRETIEAISAEAMTSADVGACETALDHIASFDEDFIFHNSYVPRACKAPRLIPHLYRLARGRIAKAGMLRDAAYASLIELGEKQALEEVFIDMGSESPSLQLEAYGAAARKDSARATELLMRQVEMEAADSRRYGDRHASRLLSNLNLEPDPVRVEAAAAKLFSWKACELAYTIRKRDPERHARILINVLESHPERPETGAMRGLANSPVKSAEIALRRYMLSKNLLLRAAATEAIGYRVAYIDDQSLSSDSFAPDLISVFSDDANSPGTRLHAAKALQKITGTPIGQIALPDDAHGARWITGWREWVRKKDL